MEEEIRKAEEQLVISAPLYADLMDEIVGLNLCKERLLVPECNIPGVPIRRFSFCAAPFLVEHQKILKDTLLVSYSCAMVSFFLCFGVVFLVVCSPLLACVMSKKTSNAGPGTDM